MDPMTKYRLALAAYHDAVWEHLEEEAEEHRNDLFVALSEMLSAAEQFRLFTWEDFWLLTAMRGDWAIKGGKAETKGEHDFAVRREIWLHDMAMRVRSTLDEATLEEEAEVFQAKEAEEIRAMLARPRLVPND